MDSPSYSTSYAKFLLSQVPIHLNFLCKSKSPSICAQIWILQLDIRSLNWHQIFVSFLDKYSLASANNSSPSVCKLIMNRGVWFNSIERTESEHPWVCFWNFRHCLFWYWFILTSCIRLQICTVHCAGALLKFCACFFPLSNFYCIASLFETVLEWSCQSNWIGQTNNNLPSSFPCPFVVQLHL